MVKRRVPSKLMAGYGAVTPRKKPEDFREVRKEFEEEVAREVVSETEIPKQPQEPPHPEQNTQ